MPGLIPSDRAILIGGLEMNALLAAGVLPQGVFESGKLNRSATAVYDPNGEILFYRVSVMRGRNRAGYADLAAFPGFGAPLLAAGQAAGWDEAAIRKGAIQAAQKQAPNMKYDQMRFVAYSYPKLAVQFLLKGQETLMLELGTWTVVPQRQQRSQEQSPSNFERWSFIDEMPANRRAEGEKSLQQRHQEWEKVCPPGKMPQGFDPLRLDRASFSRLFPELAIKTDTREVACFTLRGQLTNVWCVGASVQMILEYYRYNYQQTRVAQELGLGTLAMPNGLPYSRDNDVCTCLQTLTSSALTAHMNTTPNWAEFVTEIQNNRPLISFVPGHSRAVGGYTSTRLLTWYTFRGLLVFDPWPPTSGVLTRWENFDTTTYRRTFTAQLKMLP